jgi:hypothetical protein
MFIAVVFYVMTGWYVAAADSQSMCDYWLASNATRLHGALYANGVNEWDDPADDKHCIEIEPKQEETEG